MWSKKIEQLAEENNGKLPAILFPCIVVYIDEQDSYICADCATKEKEGEINIFGIVNYFTTDRDTEDLICDDCSKPIDPALQ